MTEPSLELHRAAERLPGGLKDAQRLVTTELDHLTAARAHRLARELGEPGGKLSGLLVTVRLGERRVAADVRDQKRPDDCFGLE